MPNDQNDIVDNQVDGILKKFYDDVNTTHLYNSASEVANDDYVTKSLAVKKCNRGIAKYRSTNRK